MGTTGHRHRSPLPPRGRLEGPDRSGGPEAVARLLSWVARGHRAGLRTRLPGRRVLSLSPDGRSRPDRLQYLWRWLGIGQATSVSWSLAPAAGNTCVTVVEEAVNPPWDWQTWNGGGWPGILDQLAAYLRTGMEWRWPWRRMGPYAQVELGVPFYEAWDRLLSPSGLRFWLQLARRASAGPSAVNPDGGRERRGRVDRAGSRSAR